MEELFKNKRFAMSLTMLLIAGAAYLAVLVLNGLKENEFIGRGVPAMTTINVSGEGEEFVIPNVAEITFSVVKDAKTVSLAQKASGEKINEIVAYLDKEGVKSEDIRNQSYSVNPKYDYQRAVSCFDNNMNGFCPTGKQVLLGYTVEQTILVKIHKLEKAGDILSALGDKGATNISGLNFTLDTELRKATENLARKKAINEAKTKAEILAKQLGVKITRMVSYNENGRMPYYGYGIGGDMMKVSTMSAEAVPSPVIPVGQSKITSNVTVTYEIE